MADFTVEYEWESCIRGHHIYYPVWTSYVGEQLVCVREPLNSVDRFAVFIQPHDTCRHRNFRTIEIFVHLGWDENIFALNYF